MERSASSARDRLSTTGKSLRGNVADDPIVSFAAFAFDSFAIIFKVRLASGRRPALPPVRSAAASTQRASQPTLPPPGPRSSLRDVSVARSRSAAALSSPILSLPVRLYLTTSARQIRTLFPAPPRQVLRLQKRIGMRIRGLRFSV